MYCLFDAELPSIPLYTRNDNSSSRHPPVRPVKRIQHTIIPLKNYENRKFGVPGGLGPGFIKDPSRPDLYHDRSGISEIEIESFELCVSAQPVPVFMAKVMKTQFTGLMEHCISRQMSIQ
jgi:hypothetical protein